ncbi:MAG: pyridoxal phosphate-dependent aminotransferase [Halobacteria archaeon]
MPRLSRRLDHIDISGIRKAFENRGGEGDGPVDGGRGGLRPPLPPATVNLALGQPDFDTPARIKAAAARALEEGRTAYTPNAGIPELREAVASKLRRENRVSVGPEQVLVTAGASEALHLALMALVNPGDEVLIPDPGFVSYAPLTRAAGGKPVGIPLRKDLTLALERARTTARTRVIIVNSPANPTGAVEFEEDLKALAEFAEDRNLILVSDEVYEEFVYEGKHASPARWAPGHVVTVNAASKTFAMTGWRLGFAAGPPEVVDGMLRLHCYIQACASSIAQHAALAAYTGPGDAVAEMRERFRKRRDFVLRALEGAGIGCARPKGAFYAFPEVGDGDRFAAETAKRGVRVVPGSAFGPRGKRHIRISYAVSEERLERGMAVLAEVPRRAP